MTNDERAIRWFENELRLLHGAPKLNGCDMTQEWQEQIDVIETALNAIKRSAPHEDPLTLDQLREMDGQPVRVHNLKPAKKKFEWQTALVCKFRETAEHSFYTYRFSEYGKTWLAYAYHPAHIDWEAWEPCGDCPNLIEAYYGNRKVRKCRAYGGLHSSKADWALKWEACGLFGAVAIAQFVSDAEKSVFMRNRKIIEAGEVQGQKEKQAEGIAISEAVAFGKCNECGFLKQCESDRKFVFPPFAWCMKRKSEILKKWED